jgi:para-nitrobenzyl esterase
MVNSAELISSTVKINSGIIEGVKQGNVFSWKGIPYARAPTGDLRFRSPQPVQEWKGVKDVSKYAPACMQTDAVYKSEDCLYLNVYRPANSLSNLPVMVWFHGGVLLHGSSTLYPGSELAKKNVVVVTVNYRLGRLGFFAHPALANEFPDEVKGNYGFLDQLYALQWVNQNIFKFGGNKSNVTIFGESAGGGSVLAHLVSPMSSGLFKRAIIQSHSGPSSRGGVFSSSSLNDAEKNALAWSRSIGANGAKELRALPAEKFVENASSKEGIQHLSEGKDLLGMAWAIIDGRFLPDVPENIIKRGAQNKVSVLVGSNDRDIGLGVATSKDALFSIFGNLSDHARELYDPLGDMSLKELEQQVFMDKTMSEPTRHLAREISRTGQATWLYRFSYVSQAQRGSLQGAMHGFEIPFAFNIPDALVGSKGVTPIDRIMAEVMSDYWVQYATSGDPNNNKLPQWPPYDPKVDLIMHFTNSGVILGTDPLKEREDLWDSYWSSQDH